VIARWLVFAAMIVTLTFILTGCGSASLRRLDAIALDSEAASVFPPGSMRRDVEAKIGTPETSRFLPDGSRLDTYTYTIRNPKWRRTHTATIVYGADDRVVTYGVPPRYGTGDDGVRAPSFTEIRGRCRAEHADSASQGAAQSAAPTHMGYGYEACVVRRITIWGVE
jgi:hypothetical protein